MTINSKQYSNGGQDKKPPAILRWATVVLHGRHGGVMAKKMMVQVKQWRSWCISSLMTEVHSVASTTRVAQGCARQL